VTAVCALDPGRALKRLSVARSARDAREIEIPVIRSSVDQLLGLNQSLN